MSPRRAAILALRFKGLLQRERKSRLAIPFRQRLSAWRHGFVSESVVNYDLSRPDDYLSDFARHVRTPDINARFKAALDNKLIFARTFPRLPTPALYFWLDHGKVFSLRDGRASDVAAVIDLCRAKGRLVVKPADGGGGKGVVIIESQNDIGQILCGRRNSLVTAFARQHAYADAIFPGAVNTVRIVTMWDYEAGGPFIAAAVHRFGRAGTGVVDNWSQGGLSVALDIETGILGKGRLHPSTGDLDAHDCHPDTGARIEGTAIPGWPGITSGILDAAASAPFLPYVGWDVVVTEDGFTVLEGNNFPDVNLMQVHRPLLSDPRVRRFYVHHGAI